MSYMQQLKTYLADHSTFFTKFEVIKMEKMNKEGNQVHAVKIDTGVMTYISDNWCAKIEDAMENAVARALRDSQYLAYYDD